VLKASLNFFNFLTKPTTNSKMAAPATAVDFSADFTTVNLADIIVNKPDRLGNVFESPFIREMLNDRDQPVSPEDNIVDIPVTPENFSRFQDRRSLSELMTHEEIENFVEFLDWLGLDVPRYIYTYMDDFGDLKISKELCERCGIDECVTRYLGCFDLPKVGKYDVFQDRVESILAQDRMDHISNPFRDYRERNSKLAAQFQMDYTYDIIQSLFTRAIRSGDVECFKALEAAVPVDQVIRMKGTYLNQSVMTETAAIAGQFEMFEYLKDHGYEVRTMSVHIIQAAGCTSPHEKDVLQVIDFIRKVVAKYKCSISQRAFDASIGEGQLLIVKFLVEECGFIVRMGDVQHAIHCEQPEIEAYLRQFDFE
jgi:hypothetical protein